MSDFNYRPPLLLGESLEQYSKRLVDNYFDSLRLSREKAAAELFNKDFRILDILGGPDE